MSDDPVLTWADVLVAYCRDDGVDAMSVTVGSATMHVTAERVSVAGPDGVRRWSVEEFVNPLCEGRALDNREEGVS